MQQEPQPDETVARASRLGGLPWWGALAVFATGLAWGAGVFLAAWALVESLWLALAVLVCGYVSAPLVAMWLGRSWEKNSQSAQV